jgi:hypothetical protein
MGRSNALQKQNSKGSAAQWKTDVSHASRSERPPMMSEISEIEKRLCARDMACKAQLLTMGLLNMVIWLMFALAVGSILEPVRQFEHGFLTVLDHMMGIR